MAISFKVNKGEADIIAAIAERADKELFKKYGNTEQKPLDTIMDITACHANGNPLRLKELLEADAFNFAHDVGGIYRHIDRTTGKLLNCFSPRYSKRD